MSGGYFDYNEYKISHIADEIQHLIDTNNDAQNLSRETIEITIAQIELLILKKTEHLKVENQMLKAKLSELREELLLAAKTIAHWGRYASIYKQEGHGLEDDVNHFTQLSNELKVFDASSSQPKPSRTTLTQL